MKIITTSILVSGTLILTGCLATLPAKVEIQKEFIPVYVCPVPPNVPQIEFEVDKLAQEGKPKPSDGTIVQAYKHDMTYLRETHKIYELILEQYRKSGKDFDTAKKEIQQLLDKMAAEEAKNNIPIP